MFQYSMSPSETGNSPYSYDTLILDKERFYKTATVCAGLVDHQNRVVLPDNFNAWTGGHNITLARNQVKALSKEVDERSAHIITAYAPIVESFPFGRNEWIHQKQMFREIEYHDSLKGVSELSVAFATGYLTMPPENKLENLIERFKVIKNHLDRVDGFTVDDFLLIASCIPPGNYSVDNVKNIAGYMEKFDGLFNDRVAKVMLAARFINHLGNSDGILVENIGTFIKGLNDKFSNLSDLEKAMLVIFPMPKSIDNTSPSEVSKGKMDVKLDIIIQLYNSVK